MNRHSSSDGSRPSNLQSSKSFSRFEPQDSATPARSRASTLQSGPKSEALNPERSGFRSSHGENQHHAADVFEKSSAETVPEDSKKEALAATALIEGLPDGFDELPIELISLTDRFIISLTTAKVYSTPPSIDKLSEIFQDFYFQAESHISTHIQTLSSRQYREASPTPSVSSRISVSSAASSKLRPKASKDNINLPEKSALEQQMLTTSEISDRRKARRLLEIKRLALEEAVERKVCEGIYDRIWRHRSTLDEIRDEKLRSRTAALALVGIGLKDLGIDFDLSKSDMSSADLVSQVEEWISKAREGLLNMNNSRYPLGKLQHLASTHQHIVDLLTTLHQSSSSADEILPTLIYTLITSPAEGINIISNLHFIQRFRANSRMNGEAAYCLTNLEAAITFLENVDLASLRSDEGLEGPTKPSSRPSTPRTEAPSPWNPTVSTSASMSSPATTPLTAVPSHSGSGSISHPLRSPANFKASPPASPSHQRRLSTLFGPPAVAFGAASDAVRTTADQGLKNISNTLDSSFKLLFGRLKEHSVQGEDGISNGTIIVPKTLDDARRLVSPKPVIGEDGNLSGASSIAEQNDSNNHMMLKADDRLLDLIGGRKPARDRSVDSMVSNGSNTSNKRVLFTPETKTTTDQAASLAQQLTVPAMAPATPLESMRNLGNTFNPLNRLAGINVMRGFGRSATVTTPPLTIAPAEQEQDETQPTDQPTPTKTKPPLQKFVDLTDANELKIGDAPELLKDYQRLAGVLKNMGIS